METSFLKLLEHSIKEHWNLPSLTDYEGTEHNYRNVARWIEKLHILFEKGGIRRETRSRYAAATRPTGASLFSLPSRTGQ